MAISRFRKVREGEEVTILLFFFLVENPADIELGPHLLESKATPAKVRHPALPPPSVSLDFQPGTEAWGRGDGTSVGHTSSSQKPLHPLEAMNRVTTGTTAP